MAGWRFDKPAVSDLMERAKVPAVAVAAVVLSHLLEIFSDQEQAGALISRFLLGDFTIEQRKLQAVFWFHDRGAFQAAPAFSAWAG